MMITTTPATTLPRIAITMPAITRITARIHSRFKVAPSMRVLLPSSFPFVRRGRGPLTAAASWSCDRPLVTRPRRPTNTLGHRAQIVAGRSDNYPPMGRRPEPATWFPPYDLRVSRGRSLHEAIAAFMKIGSMTATLTTGSDEEDQMRQISAPETDMSRTRE